MESFYQSKQKNIAQKIAETLNEHQLIAENFLLTQVERSNLSTLYLT